MFPIGHEVVQGLSYLDQLAVPNILSLANELRNGLYAYNAADLMLGTGSSKVELIDLSKTVYRMFAA